MGMYDTFGFVQLKSGRRACGGCGRGVGQQREVEEMSVDAEDYATWYEYELDVIAEKRMDYPTQQREVLWFIAQLLVEVLRKMERDA